MSVSMCVDISNELDTASAAAAHFLLLLLYGEQSDGMYEWLVLLHMLEIPRDAAAVAVAAVRK